jgi:hypothetical protein
MAEKLVTLTAQLTTISEIVTLPVPNLSSTMALRLDNKGSQIRLVMLMSDDTIKSTHPRSFSMTPDGIVVPNFKKFIGQRVMGGQTVNIIEVTAQPQAEPHHSLEVKVEDYKPASDTPSL